MGFFKFFISKTFWINVLIAIVIFLLIILGLTWSLTSYTTSGRTIIVPSLTGNTVRQIEEKITNVGLEYVVIDSIHRADALPGTIVEQIPAAGMTVKKGRKLFLTINAWSQEMVVMPQLVDCSLRNAQVVLETSGLRLAKIIYKPSNYDGLVMGQQCDGAPIKAGTKVPKGTNIQLIVGSGTGGNNVIIPELIGLTLAEAEIALKNDGLAIGSLIYDETVVRPDTLSAVVYRQNPGGDGADIREVGSEVSLWLTKNSDIVIDAMEEIENNRNK